MATLSPRFAAAKENVVDHILTAREQVDGKLGPDMRSKKKPSTSFRFGLLVIFILGLVIRLSYFYFAQSGPLGNPDSFAYEDLARTIREGEAYTTSFPGGPGGFPADLQRPPGYPAFLAVVNPSTYVDRVWTAAIQSVLGAVFGVCLALIVGHLSTARVGLLAGVFYAIDWVTFIHTPMIIAETLYTILLTLAVCSYAFYIIKQRAFFAFAAGLLLGLAALTKPVAQVLVIAFLIAWLFQPKRRLVGLAFLITYGICVAPWMIRNYQQHGLFTLSSISTAAIYFYNAAGATKDYSWQELSAKVDELDGEWNNRRMSAPDRKRQMEQESWELIVKNLPLAMKQAAVGFARTCVGTARETMMLELGGLQMGWALHTGLPLLMILLLWALAIIGVFAGLRYNSMPGAVTILFIGTILFSLLPASSLMGNSRYRVPVVPILCVLSAVGATWAVPRMRLRRFLKAEGQSR